MDDALLQEIPEHLRAVIGAVFAKAQKAERLEMEVRILREQLRLAIIKRHCPSAERLSDGQLALLLVEPSTSLGEVLAEAALPEALKAAVLPPEQDAGPHRLAKQQPIRKPLPAHLPREERIIACSEAECRCGQCGGEKKIIGYETSERLSLKPLVYYVEVTKREKRACPRCEELGVSIAPVPPAIVEKGIMADRLVIDVAIQKYSDHQPLYRQALSVKRDAQIELSQATLCNAMMNVGALAIPICGAMKQDLLSGGYIQADETPVPVQSPHTKGKDHRAYIWQYSRPGGPVVYEFRMGREREGPKNFLKNYGGILQTDAYSAYETTGAKGMVHIGCMAHARRKFSDAAKLDPKDARPVAVLKKIGELYGIEELARQAKLDEEKREALRAEKSVPILAELKSLILQTKTEALPKSMLGRGCDYALSNWEKLKRYADKGFGRVEIDNNWAENAMRPITLGRKNWLHIGSEEAGPKVAAIMGIVETCKRLKINVRQYMEEVFPRVADWPISRIAELTPMAWLAAQTQSE